MKLDGRSVWDVNVPVSRGEMADSAVSPPPWTTPGNVGEAAAVTTRIPNAYRWPATTAYDEDQDRVPELPEFAVDHRVVSLATDATNATELSDESTVHNPIRHSVGVAPAAVPPDGTRT